MIGRLAIAEIRHRPGRAAFLLGGYAFGVAVMVVLLAVGEAMLTQARDQALLGGGDLVLVPAGISPEMLKSGGATSLFLGLDQARFIHRQILESPRGRQEFGVTSASPILDARLVRISRGDGSLLAIAAGELPDRAAAAGAAPTLLAGSWSPSEADRRWASPSPAELYDEIDAFHRPPPAAAGDSTWAEWHYFNVVLDEQRWIYLTYMIAGRVGRAGEWGGRLILSVHQPESGHVTYTRDIGESTIELDTTRADLTLDADATVRQADGTYQLRARLAGAEIDLRLTPRPNRLFPPADLGGEELVSGYVVPALTATAEGRVCLPTSTGARCEDVLGARAYHDHNWGVWREVSWEWGAASDDSLSLLYGVVNQEGAPSQPLFAYLVDGNGVRGLFRPAAMEFLETRATTFAGANLEVPTRMRFIDARRGLSVEIEVGETQISDMERDSARFFLQMRGRATVTESGLPPRVLAGFFETYVDPVPAVASPLSRPR